MNITSQTAAYTHYFQNIQESYGNGNFLDAIIFDCDGVLVDSEESGNRIEVEELRSHGCSISVEDYNARFAGRTTKDAFEILANENNVIFHPGFVKSVEKKTLAVLEKEAFCIPGIRETLEKINLPKAVVSNAYNEKLHALLRINNLLPYFDGHIYSADLVEHPKPYPDVYELAAREMSIIPERCLVIEDSEAGVKAAKAAGMHVFGFFGGSHHDANYAKVLEEAGVEVVFNDMSVLPKLVAFYIPTI
ncbi:MAG: HAD-IA family hydrolase [Pseudomonadota bacterium]